MAGSDGAIEPTIPPPRPRADVLVGRTDEVARLRAALEAAAGGRPTIVLLLGEAGIGKTRLADEAAAMARAAGMRVLYGEADAAVREPMELWRGVYRSLGVEVPGDPTLPAAERRWERLDALAEGLRSSAPVVVILDDLHWADDMAVWVLEHLPRALGEAPTMLVAASRDHEPDMPRLDPLKRVSRLVPLAGLDVDAVRQLAATQAAASVDAIELQARTGGNPLFVRELLSAPDDGGVIGEVLERSLARFDDDARELLAAAALAGAGAPLAVLAAAVSTTTATAADRLAPAVRHRVLSEVAPTGVRFRHALLADAAARVPDVRALHERLGGAWEAIGGLGGRAAAAGHGLHAAADPAARADAIAAVCDVAAELVAAGQHTRAAGLLRDASSASVEGMDRPELRARLLLHLADVLAWLGDFDPALEHYQEAAELARRSTDPLLRARAEIGAALHVSPFVANPLRLRQLEEALAALPADAPHLRAALLGRLAVIGGADLDVADQARAWADEAVEVARQTDDPLLVVQALLDRHISPRGRHELDEQVRAADEVVRLAERAGRGDLAIQGHQWHVTYALNHGDLVAAGRALDRAELLGELLAAPSWRYSALIRRATLHAVVGSRAAASAAMAGAVRIGSGAYDPLAVLGFEMGHRLMLLELYGGTDPVVEERYRQIVQMIGDVPIPFLQVMIGYSALAVDDHSRVHAVLRRYARQPAPLVRSLAGDMLIRLLGEMVARTRAAPFVGPVYDALAPFAGLLNVGNGSAAGLPVDDVLGRLAMVGGDAVAAVRHAEDAVTIARSLPSPPMLVHCLDHLADARSLAGEGGAEAARAEAEAIAVAAGVERAGRPSAAPVRTDRTATMRRRTDGWEITSPLGAARLSPSTGLGQLARLLSQPGSEVSAIELAGALDAPVAADLGPALDGQAKRAYRQRLLELQTEVDDAAACHDPARGERAELEIDLLLRELERAVGLGGRDRPTGSGAERARVNVVRSLKRAVAAIAQQAPDLGAHLEVSLRTGRYCAYAPEPAAALPWKVTDLSAEHRSTAVERL